MLFSHFLESGQLKKVTYYSYFPVLPEMKNGIHTYRLLPSDDCMAYTVTFEAESKKIIKGEKNWFNSALIDRLDAGRYVPAEKQKFIDFSKKKHNKCIFFNLLDFCYGHSLVKLLNIYNFYQEYKETHDLFIISFPDIGSYMPKDRFNTCFLDLTFSQINTIYNLENIINEVRKNYETVDFPVLDAYLKIDDRKAATDFFNFYGDGPDLYKGKKIVSLYYRKEPGRKLWGNMQVKQATVFLHALKQYFDEQVLFCILGDKDEAIFPDWILDKRTGKYPNPMVYEYSQIISASVLIIGVIGSNLVLPSLISPGMIVHMVKEDFTRLTATDALNYRGYAIQTAFEHVYLHEDLNRPDYTPQDLAFKLVRLFEGKLFIDYRNLCLELLKNHAEIPQQEEYILKEHSYFKYKKARELGNDINQMVFKKQGKQMLLSLFKKNPSVVFSKVISRLSGKKNDTNKQNKK